MSDDEPDAGPRLRSVILGGIASAALTGRADPAPLDRPWPRGLRWTRAVGIGRLPFGLVVNALLALVTLLMVSAAYSNLFGELHRPVRPPHAPPQPGAWEVSPPSAATLLLIALAVCLPLLLLDRHPLGAWRFSFVSMAVVDVRGWLSVPFVPAGSLTMIASLFAVAVRCERRTTAGVALITAAGVWIKGGPDVGPGGTVLVLLPLLAGYLVRSRRTSRQRLAAEAKRHRDAEAVLKERQRIARELHDVVAHHMSMIAIQAEAAPYRVAELPDETRGDLAEIRATALDALTEMRRILGVLRSEGGADTAPQPGLDRLDELVAGARGTGLTVEAEVSGDLADLPPGVQLTAYRIVQEALSNAMRHAPGSRVALSAVRERGILALRVVNGPPAPGQRPTGSPPGSGHGIVGMRERAAMLGGGLAAGATPEGGFAVEADLPVRGSA